MIDYFSKWAEAYALPNHNSETVADCILKPIMESLLGHRVTMHLNFEDMSLYSWRRC